MSASLKDIAPQRQASLAAEVKAIKRLSASIEDHGKRVVDAAIEIGRRLEKSKKIVGHGGWLSWLRENFNWSSDTAERYMRLHAISTRPKFRTVRNLPLAAAYALTARNAPSEVVDDILRRLESGEHLTAAAVKGELRLATIKTIPRAVTIAAPYVVRSVVHPATHVSTPEQPPMIPDYRGGPDTAAVVVDISAARDLTAALRVFLKANDDGARALAAALALPERGLTPDDIAIVVRRSN